METALYTTGEREARWNRAPTKAGEIESRIASHDATWPAAPIDLAAFGLFASHPQLAPIARQPLAIPAASSMITLCMIPGTICRR